MIKTEHPHVVKVPNVRAGRAIIAGTRIPVWIIAANMQEGCSPQDILEHYPQLTPAQLHDAISYYYDHSAEIEAEIRDTISRMKNSLVCRRNGNAHALLR